MSLTALLSVAIALSFAYFLLSSVASAIVEAGRAVVKTRPKQLEKAILLLVGGVSKPKGEAQKSAGDAPQKITPAEIAESVYNHSLVSGLSSIAKPSYVPARNFTHAVVDVLVKGGGADVMDSLQKAIDDLPPDHPLTQALRSAATQARGDFEAFRVLVDKWFDDAMDRLSGVYKRYTQLILFGLGLVLAALLNVDTVHMVGSLLSDDKQALASVVEAATRTTRSIADDASQHKTKTTSTPAKGTDQTKATNAGQGTGNTAVTATNPADGAATGKTTDASQGTQPDAAAKPTDGGATDSGTDADALFAKQIADSKQSILEAMDDLLKSGLPVGWQVCPTKKDAPAVTCWRAGDKHPTINGLGSTVLGWLLTAIAVSFGAPFWFDLLNTFVNLRAAGPKPKATNKGDSSATS